MGGGYLLGHGHKHEQHQQHGLGKVTQSMAMAGAGAIGAKIFGLFGNKQQHQPPPPQTQVHVYPVYVPGPQAAPSPGPPSCYGQPPPAGQNLGHYNSTPDMTPLTQPYHHGGGVQSPATGGMGAFTPQNGPPLHIYGAVFADRDVTQIVRNLATPQQTLILTGDTLVEKLGDPWSEAERKMFNVLYSYGDRPMELIAAELVIPVS